MPLNSLYSVAFAIRYQNLISPNINYRNKNINVVLSKNEHDEVRMNVSLKFWRHDWWKEDDQKLWISINIL